MSQSAERRAAERRHQVAIRAALSIEAYYEALEQVVALAAAYIEHGWTQEGADLLAYVLQHAERLPEDIVEQAQEQHDDLARYICPRVLLDAADFGQKATFDDILEYIFSD